MSIYCSREVVGRDWWEKRKSRRDKGRVVTFPHNNLRTITENWPRGQITTADIPHWCIPGHDQDDPACCDDRDTTAEWMRLDIDDGSGASLRVLIDVKAARRLGRELTAWAKEPHAPTPPNQEEQ